MKSQGISFPTKSGHPDFFLALKGLIDSWIPNDLTLVELQSFPISIYCWRSVSNRVKLEMTEILV